MDFTIERATPEDAEELLLYLKQIGKETDNLTFGEEGLPFTVEEEQAFLSGMQNTSNGIMLLAKSNGRIVGNASLSRLPRRMSHCGDLSISVARSHWGIGIGSALMEELLLYAKSNAYESIDLQVRSDNLRAIQLYRKFGFQSVGTRPSLFKIDSRYADVDFMYLLLK